MSKPEKKPRVLVVDDNHDIAETLAMAFTVAGFEVQTAFDRDEASRKMTDFQPNMIFLDYWMPGMSASLFVNRARSQCPNSKLVIITAMKDAAAIANMLNADAYFGKPLDFDRMENYAMANA